MNAFPLITVSGPVTDPTTKSGANLKAPFGRNYPAFNAMSSNSQKTSSNNSFVKSHFSRVV